MDELNVERRLTDVEGRTKSNSHRIDKLEDISEAIHKQNETLAELVNELKHTNARLQDHEGRLSEIEDRAEGKLDHLWRTIVTVLISGTLGAFVAAILPLLK